MTMTAIEALDELIATDETFGHGARHDLYDTIRAALTAETQGADEIIQRVQASLEKAFITQRSLGDPSPEKRHATVDIEYRNLKDMHECFNALVALSDYARASLNKKG